MDGYGVVVRGETGRTTYRDVLRAIIAQGTLTKTRKMMTLDVGPMMIILNSPQDALPLGIGRNLSRKIAAVEAIQLIGGFCDDDKGGLIERNAPQLLKYADVTPDGSYRLWGGYGRRIGSQLIDALGKIRLDQNTRQAVIQLWDPTSDNTAYKSDYPCTLSLQIRVHMGRLCMMTTMRSNDAWMGLPYDLFQFTQLQLSIATILNMVPGPYTHFVGSMHLYQHNVADTLKLIESTAEPDQIEPQPNFGIGMPKMTTHGLIERAGAVAYARQLNVSADYFTESERWYVDVLG